MAELPSSPLLLDGRPGGGLAPAGKILRVGQSALSGQIKRLEEGFGYPLFERRGRRLEMTEMGRLVFRYAEEIFGLGQELMDAVRDQWFDSSGVRPIVVAEAEDSALLKAFASDGMGGLFVPTVISKVVGRRYDLHEVAEIHALRERFYAISAERRLVHPAVIAIRAAARNDLFA